MDNRQPQKPISENLILFFFILRIALWLGSGYLAWHWINPTSFGGGLLFIIVGGVLGTIAQSTIPMIVAFLIFNITSPLEKTQSPAISPSQNPLPYIPANQKKPTKDYSGWIIFGFIGLCVLSYFYMKSDDKQSKTANAYNYSATQNPSSNDYTKSQTPTAQCYDGTYSYSTGRKGTCSHHGGVQYWLDSQSSSYIRPLSKLR